ncbi:MAG: Putative cytochrome c [uncultured Thiotrichaceae bacterium]|uniref:Cytochrome c n=1 Tax=uncultured Thiotrichaceae bacterium TaxID=298394 RepID=A0A6S6SNJ9_9GAMM|nr:MAG: Putative cytochrome c [uncultured Thiotrichaceae bacterium]
MKTWKILLAALLLMPAYGNTNSELGSKNEPQMLTTIHDSPYDFDKTVLTLREAIESHNFRTFPDRFLEQGLTDEFSVNQRQLSIRFCNFNQLDKALKLEPRLGVLLPCAITVIEHENGEVQLFAANISAMAALFDNAPLTELIGDLQDSYDDIIEEVTF